MNRHSCREKAMICLYQHRLLNKPIDEIIEEVMEMKPEELDDFGHILILDHPGKFIAGKRVTPEELARQCRLAQDYPFVYTRGPRPKKSPQIEGR